MRMFFVYDAEDPEHSYGFFEKENDATINTLFD